MDSSGCANRKPEHDKGSVQNIVTTYMRQRQLLRSGGQGKPGTSGYVKGGARKK